MNSTEDQPRQCNLLEYVENHPVAAITQALAIGFAVGLVVRLLEGGGSRDPKIDVKRKPTLDEAKFHLGSLLLPFLWPAWQKAQEGYGKSSDTVRDTLDKLKKSDLSGLSAEGRKHLKKAEEWAEREAVHLAKMGKSRAKEVEKWVEDEVLPAAETGWKKLRKYLS
ncbi:MAG TPA: hypothetical protein VHY22_17605 [Chthoniobacteraceae bacterium]|jgi:hypothetical protein|nr:hypothetical protein [Chthoniobacteraceae bacterium]